MHITQSVVYEMVMGAYNSMGSVRDGGGFI